MANVRPFQFTGLPRLSREQAAVQESLAAYLSYRPFEPRFANDLGAELERYLKAPCKFSAFSIKAVNCTDLPSLLPALSCLIVVGAAPTEHKIIAEIDPSLAGLAIERLLGGPGEGARIRRPLTEIEEGVLSFLILAVLGHFHNGWHTGRELGLTLDRFANKLDELSPIVDNETGYYMLSVSIGVGSHVGYARILLPQGLITQTFASHIPQSHGTPEELDRMRRLLGSLGEAQIVARAEIARIDLTDDDIANLELGDIILLENHEVTKTEAGVTGNVLMRLGMGQNGGLRCSVVDDGDHTHLRVIEILQQEQPQETSMTDGEEGSLPADGEDYEASDNLPETEGLLRDVPAPVVVELGRIKMSTAQVVRLRTGQILRLSRGSNDPVDLVVNGKIFARGELIEVDGELGVRLVQVVGAG